LETAGSSLQNRSSKDKLVIYLKKHFQAFNEAYGEQFGGHKQLGLGFAVQELSVKGLCEIEVYCCLKEVKVRRVVWFRWAIHMMA